MPVFWFALSQINHFSTTKAVFIFFILHLFLYPASNAYNSYFDKDEGSIGGLENPPRVDEKLFYVAWLFDLIALVWAWLWVGKIFAIAILIYGLVSKAYSHSAVRLKKYPIISWLVVGFFQGTFIYFSIIQALLDVPIKEIFVFSNIFPALLSSMVLWAVYPITQVFQHEEDAQRGDKTLSLLLGIRGTFIFTLTFFGASMLGFYIYFSLKTFIWLTVALLPTSIFFLFWLNKVWKNPQAANFRNTMLLNALASLGFNIFYISLSVFKNV
jgi:1,4-dihydroxy-2-naphthoate octaprenyltransferase